MSGNDNMQKDRVIMTIAFSLLSKTIYIYQYS